MFYLNKEERLALARKTIEAAKGKVGVVVSGHIEDRLPEQAEFLQEMAKLCPDAIVLVSNRLRQRDEASGVLIKNVEYLLKVLPENIPMGIYECPYPEKVLLRDDEISYLASTGRFIFMKDTCCDLDVLRHRINLLRDKKMKLYNANTATYLDSLCFGGDGFCGVMLNMQPKIYRYLSDYYQEDLEKSRQIQQFLTISSIIERQQYPANAKYYLQLEGLPIKTICRNDIRPFCKLFQNEVEQLYKASHELETDIG